MFIDSHCHLDFPELAAHRANVLALMRSNAVTHALTISTTLNTFPAVRAVAEANENIWCSAGVSAGIDLTLAFIASVAGDEVAGKVQFASEYFPSPKTYGNYTQDGRAPAYIKSSV